MLHIEVKPGQGSPREMLLHPQLTEVFVSRNGYQWSGFSIERKSELIRLRDALTKRIDGLD